MPKDVLVYFLRQYPHKHELSRSRLMSMVYLADWKTALERGALLTPARWTLGNFGPYAEDVYEAMEDGDTFTIVMGENVHGTAKGLVELSEAAEQEDIDDADRVLLDFVIDTTKLLRWSELIGLLYSTYPMIAASDRGDVLELPRLAEQYKASQNLLNA